MRLLEYRELKRKANRQNDELRRLLKLSRMANAILREKNEFLSQKNYELRNKLIEVSQ